MRKLTYGYFAEKENKRWFWARVGGGLYYRDKLNGNIVLSYIYQDENVIKNGDCWFEHMIFLDDLLLLVPRYAKEILLLDIEQNKVVKRFLLEKIEEIGEYFLGVIQTEQEVILIPQSYRKILHINKQSLQLRTGEFDFREHCLENKLCIPSDVLHFRAFPIIHNGNIYLPFYDFPQILIYDIDSMMYSVCDTHKIEGMDQLEIYENDEFRLLIIERLDCLRIEDNDKAFPRLLGDFLNKHDYLGVADYANNVYLLMKDGIFVFHKGGNEIKIADWFSQIDSDYVNRVHDQEGERLQDTLYVFQNEGILFITFELEEYKCIIKICEDEVSIKYEKIEKIDEVFLLLKALELNGDNQNKLTANSVGKMIYKSLI